MIPRNKNKAIIKNLYTEAFVPTKPENRDQNAGPNRAEIIIERGLKEKINTLRQNPEGSTLIGTLSQRLSALEKELGDIKHQLLAAQDIIKEKDKEIYRLKTTFLDEGQKALVTKTGPANRPIPKEGDKKKNALERPQNKQRGVGDVHVVEKIQETYEDFDDEGVLKSVTTVEKTKLNPPNGPTFTKMRSAKKKSPDGKWVEQPDAVIVRPGANQPEFLMLDDDSYDDISEDDSEDSVVQELLEENKKLCHKIEAMEKFMGDYGLAWVGDKAIYDEGQIQQPMKKGRAAARPEKPSTTPKCKPNLDKVISSVADMNIATSETQVVSTSEGGKFKKCDVLELVLFANGMKLESNPFRAYDTPSAEAFFKDLEDGYYPTELKSRHPQGIVDRRNECYDVSNTSPGPFGGKGYKLGNKQDFGDGSTPEGSPANRGRAVRPQQVKPPQPVSPPQFVGPPQPRQRPAPVRPNEDGNQVPQPMAPRPKEYKVPEPNHQPKPPMRRTPPTSPVSAQIVPHSPPGIKVIDHSQPPIPNEIKELWVSDNSPKQSAAIIHEVAPKPESPNQLPSVPTLVNLSNQGLPSFISHPPLFTPPQVPSPVAPSSRIPSPTSDKNSVPRTFSSHAPPNTNHTVQTDLRPIEITNITYHEAPTTFQISPRDFDAMNRNQPTSVEFVRDTTKVVHGCKGVCEVTVPQKDLCPCASHLKPIEPPKYEHPVIFLKPRPPPPNEIQIPKFPKFAGITEYTENYSKPAEGRLKMNPPKVPSEKAFNPSDVKPTKIDTTEEFEHFTFYSQPNDPKAGEDNRGSSKKNAVVELNKKESDTMITLKLRSDKGNKTYLAHVYPHESIKRIWSLLKLNGEEYEMVSHGGQAPVVILGDKPLQDQNINNNTVVTVRPSPDAKRKGGAFKPEAVQNEAKKHIGKMKNKKRGSDLSEQSEIIPEVKDSESEIEYADKIEPILDSDDDDQKDVKGKVTSESPASRKVLNKSPGTPGSKSSSKSPKKFEGETKGELVPKSKISPHKKATPESVGGDKKDVEVKKKPSLNSEASEKESPDKSESPASKVSNISSGSEQELKKDDAKNKTKVTMKTKAPKKPVTAQKTKTETATFVQHKLVEPVKRFRPKYLKEPGEITDMTLSIKSQKSNISLPRIVKQLKPVSYVGVVDDMKQLKGNKGSDKKKIIIGKKKSLTNTSMRPPSQNKPRNNQTVKLQSNQTIKPQTRQIVKPPTAKPHCNQLIEKHNFTNSKTNDKSKPKRKDMKHETTKILPTPSKTSASDNLKNLLQQNTRVSFEDEKYERIFHEKTINFHKEGVLSNLSTNLSTINEMPELVLQDEDDNDRVDHGHKDSTGPYKLNIKNTKWFHLMETSKSLQEAKKQADNNSICPSTSGSVNQISKNSNSRNNSTANEKVNRKNM